MTELLQNYLLEILATVLTAVASFIGLALKKKYTEIINDKEKKEIVDAVVKYVEQMCKTCGTKTSAEKKEMAKTKALEWLNEKGLAVSETELDILIEATVNGFNAGLKKE